MPPSSRRPGALLAAATVSALLGGLLVAAPAQATAPVLTTLPTSGSNPTYGDLAVDGDGDVTALWIDYVGGWTVRVADRPVGTGTWSAPTDLSTSTLLDAPAHLAADAAGNVLVVWGAAGQISARYRPAGSATWSAVQSVGPGYMPHVAANADGLFALTWSNSSNQMATIWTPSGGFASTATLGAGNTSTSAIAIGDDGHVTAAWSYGSSVMTATRTPAGTWLAAETAIANYGSAGFVDVTVGPNGHAGVIAARNGASITASDRTSGAWTAPTALGTFGYPGSAPYEGPDLVAEPDGDLTAVWTSAAGMLSSATLHGSAWGTTVPITPASGPGAVAVHPDGSLTVVAPRTSPSTQVVAVSADPSGAWSAPNVLAAETGRLMSAVALGEDVVATWTATGSTTRAAVVDAVAPQVRQLDVPATATSGSALTLAVDGVDRSGIASITWDLGDGTTATGPSVQHTYAAAGTYTVTLTLTDQAGNVTVRTRTVTVGAMPVAPPVVTPETPVSTPTPTTEPGTVITVSPDSGERGRFDLALDHRRIALSGQRATTVAEVTLPRTARVRISLLHHQAKRKSREGKLMNRATVVRTLKAGTHDIAIRTSMGKHGLRPGTYTLTAKAVGLPGRPSVSRTLTVRR